ncbi:unnamed protein product [Adineta steineri]|uniref:Uncharacterized protein n=1 Tax=Adineta steineri TaxID=433720 RepID=A0A820K6M5_9BILA|nr:unnamed protein product [Adineta steineri]
MSARLLMQQHRVSPAYVQWVLVTLDSLTVTKAHQMDVKSTLGLILRTVVVVEIFAPFLMRLQHVIMANAQWVLATPDSLIVTKTLPTGAKSTQPQVLRTVAPVIASVLSPMHRRCAIVAVVQWVLATLDSLTVTKIHQMDAKLIL